MPLLLRCALLALMAALAIGGVVRPARAVSCNSSGSGAYGTLDMSQTSATATGSMTINCTLGFLESLTGESFTIGIGPGSVGTSTQRRFISGSSALTHELYQDVGLTGIWGSATNVAAYTPGSSYATTVGYSGSSLTATIPVYGRITYSTAVPPGTYAWTDTTSPGGSFIHCNILFGCWFLIGGGNISAAGMTWTVNVPRSCTVSTAALDFGGNGLINTNIDAVGTINLTCSTGTYRLGLGQGLWGTAVTDRKMKSGSNTIDYKLFRESARSTNWGETDTVDTVDFTSTGASQNISVYGRVPAQTSRPAGTYSDSVAITIYY